VVKSSSVLAMNILGTAMPQMLPQPYSNSIRTQPRNAGALDHSTFFVVRDCRQRPFAPGTGYDPETGVAC
jgi:hypothetical protein